MNIKLPSLVGYRTYIATGLTMIFGILATVNWNDFFQDPKTGITAIVLSVLYAYLRTITNTPPLQPDTPKPDEPGYIPEVKKYT